MSETGELLDSLSAYWRRFLSASEAQIDALAVWTLHTYVFDSFNTTPYLLVTSAEMGSGKSTVLEVLDVLAASSYYTTALTEATLFRMIEKYRPTLLLDEQDRALRERHGELSDRQEMLVAIINLGYRRKGRVPRLSPMRELEWFSCYCPKALAAIGRLPPTIEHRSLPIRMVRMDDATKLEEFDEDLVGADGEVLRLQCERWSSGASLILAGVLPSMPEALDRRAKQAYRALVAIGDLAGDEWSQRVRDAVVTLRVAAAGSPKASQGVRLLRDIHLFLDRLSGMERITTTALLDLLYAEGDEPWEEWWGATDSKKAPRRLALALGEYDLKPYKWFEAGVTHRGYEAAPLCAAVHLYGSDTPSLAMSGDLQDFSEGATRHAAPIHGVLESEDLQGHGVYGVLKPETNQLDLGTASLDELHKHFDPS